MNLLVKGRFILEKFSGKVGWTYIRLSAEIITSGKAFGMMKVSGPIDNYMDCLKDDPGKFGLFQKQPNTEQQQWVEYI